MSFSRTTIAASDARASSFSTDATPPRVASRRQRRCGPAAASSASTAVHSGRVSDSTSASRSNSPRASMIAVPCSPIEPETSTRSPARRFDGARRARSSTRPMPGRAEVHRVGVTALDDLRVPGHDLDARGRGGQGDRLDLCAQDVGGEALLEDHREAERERPRAAHGEIVDGAVDRELADRAAREADGLDDEAVRREGEPRAAGLDRRDVGEHVEHRRGEGRARARPRSASAWPCRRRRAPS